MTPWCSWWDVTLVLICLLLFSLSLRDSSRIEVFLSLSLLSVVRHGFAKTGVDPSLIVFQSRLS
jgi:hypothetical protein